MGVFKFVMKSRVIMVRWLLVAAALLVALGLKAALIISGRVPFNADEAIVALMARHILQGERPVFFYGQAYMGSLDAALVALGFQIFGERVWVIRLVQSTLYAGTLLSTVSLGRATFRSWRVGMVAAWLLAIPAVSVSLYTTASLGGYGEALLLGNLILLDAIRIANDLEDGLDRSLSLWILLGFLSGLGIWAFGITLIYSVPAVLYLIWKFTFRHTSASSVKHLWIKLSVRLGLAGIGAFLGAIPWWVYALRHGLGNLLGELGGSAIAGVERLSWLLGIVQHLFSFVLLGSTVMMSIRPPWEVRCLGIPLLPFALIFWMLVFGHTFKLLSSQTRKKPGIILLVGVMASLLAAFILTPFGADPSGRYFLPLAVPLAIFAADLILALVTRFGKYAWGVLALVLVYNLWGTVQCALLYPPGLTTQIDAVTRIDHRYDSQLIAFLQERGLARGFTNYWVSYPLAFLTQEKLIFVPRLPYHHDFRYTERDDRYPLYDDMVKQADQLTYITTLQPKLEDFLRQEFIQDGATWKEEQIGDYKIFYDFSQKVNIDSITSGVFQP